MILATALPFVVLLLAIALAPLVTPQWLHHNRNKAIVAFVVSLPILIYLGMAAPQAHIVIFFIFIVANCGGLLTPIGDPPLLLGFLKGVPFDWTLRLWPQWLLVNGILLIVFNVWDRWAHEPDEKELIHEPLRVRGALAIVGLIGVLVT